MPIHIGWLVENRVSYFKYVGDVTLEEVQEASKIGLQMIDQRDAPLLHTIQDNQEMRSFPTKVNDLIKVVNESLSHPHMGWMLSIGIESNVIRFVAKIVIKLAQTRSRLFPTLDEGKLFLNDRDPTLPDLGEITPPQIDDMLYHIRVNESEIS